MSPQTNSTAPAFPGGTILGYPRIGRNRELKKALESFWKGATTAVDLESAARDIRLANLERMAELGLGRGDSSIPSNFSFYDHMLDASVAFGCVPSRFKEFESEHGGYDLAGYSTIARGQGDKAPLEMTKWFDSNYHFLVPEIGPETTFELGSIRWIDEFVEARNAGFLTRPVVTGPLTFLYLAKPSDEAPRGFRPIDRLADLLPVYEKLLGEFKIAGAQWVQIDEPILVADFDAPRADVLAAAKAAYAAVAGVTERPSVFVAAPYASLDEALPVLAATGVEAISLDLVRGTVPRGVNLAGKTVVAGV
ncbi:MAG TPA: 5-methyltetrahydropteroyltriglutamate--homocysteine S-methyltransferase, partial [Demequinaceae bacterium]